MTSSAAVNTTTRLGTRVRANVFRTSRHIERARPARAGGSRFYARRCLAFAESFNGRSTVFIDFKFPEPPRPLLIGDQNIWNLKAHSFLSGRRNPSPLT